jgi:hypothetical protein
MDAGNSFYVKLIATDAPKFFGYIVSVLAMVCCLRITQTKNELGLGKPTTKLTPLYYLFENSIFQNTLWDACHALHF